MPIIIRLFKATDSEGISELTKRLADFQMPPWRTQEIVDRCNKEYIQTAMDELSEEPGSGIFTAEDDENGKVVGFIHLQTRIDYFSKGTLGYIAKIAVDQNSEGRGIGRMLMAKAEEWAKEKGFDRLALHVFVENEKAQELYKKIGYQEDVRGYVKMLKED